LEQEERIKEILGEKCNRNQKNMARYFDYLKSAVKYPCRLTGMEDFPWEEAYVFGGLGDDEYEELKKENPSYTDVFELLELTGPDSELDDIVAKLQRLTDYKIFNVGLSWLQCFDPNDVNFQLFDDYASWHTNY